MKKVIGKVLLSLMISISLFGCTSNEIEMPHGSKYYIDKEYNKIKKQLKKEGFKNIQSEYIKDVYEEYEVGTIKEISINGDKTFDKDEKYHKDSKIKIIVHDIKDINLPLSSEEINGKTVKEVETTFEDAGFSNVLVEDLRDLTTRENDQQIEKVLIDKQITFDKNKLYPANVEIIIKHHGIKKEYPPISSKKSKGKNYKDIVKKFEKAKFTNVKVKKIEDLITGLLTSDGEVEKVTINGKKYDMYTEYDIDSPVVISYHTFEESDKETTTTNTEENTSISEDDSFSSGEAWSVLKRYGKQVYPYGFKVHNFLGVINEERIDNNTWFLKAEVTITNQYGAKRDTVVQAKVSRVSPYIWDFYVS